MGHSIINIRLLSNRSMCYTLGVAHFIPSFETFQFETLGLRTARTMNSLKLFENCNDRPFALE